MNHLYCISSGLAWASHLKCTSEPSNTNESFTWAPDDELNLLSLGGILLSIFNVIFGAYRTFNNVKRKKDEEKEKRFE